ncbi:probable L-type lectin-domain containing receptor kinase I.6 [Pistacia vera]|uniref:probable L-type lectin-domain containing receptor kinase I.6 n=1 Tax=Pistacia vera TaxID=55513 RepID=UPI001262F9A3|nr:probable L-type lectin-domain containing receptor kinase I.6 [Pistacia vera]
MAAAHRSLLLWIVFNVYLISLTSAQDENQFIYHGFSESKLHLDGMAEILSNGLLQLTNATQLQTGHAFYPFSFKFNVSSYKSLSFSTNFVFGIVPDPNNKNSGHGMAFVISPSLDLSKSKPTSYLGLFNSSNYGLSTNHILAVELDTVQSAEYNDINGNHVGIDVNNLESNESATATYFSDEEVKNITLELASGNPMQIWIDFDETEKLLNVTLSPIRIPKPNRPLLSTSIDLSQIFLDSMYVGFSASTGELVSGQYILGWSFNKSGQAQNLDITKLPSLPVRGSKKRILKIIASLIAAVVVLIATGATVYIFQKKKYEELCEDWERQYGPHRFSYKNLYKATKGFNDKELIGEGGFGKVYRGVLPSSNEQIAVKKVSHDSKQGMSEFVAEIVSMGRLRHRNLVQLRGYCRRRQELILVYDYMSHGSLDKMLYSDTRPGLNWFQRFRILRGIASGLLYLHEDGEQVVLHRDIKPGNILLDVDLSGKLGDFGLARFYDHGSTPKTTNLIGTLGYLAPELLRIGKATTSTDVFAFGACMLEAACGRKPMAIDPENLNLVDWVIDCWKRGNILDAADPRLEGLYGEEQMELVLKLGLFCSHPNPAARPSMRQVMQNLDGDVMLPHITPDGPLIAAFTATNEASNVLVNFSELLERGSSHTMSTVESILIEGR